MEKRHFIAIARVFSDTRPEVLREGDPNDPTWIARCDQWRSSVYAMARYLDTTNSRFNRDKFIEVCNE